MNRIYKIGDIADEKTVYAGQNPQTGTPIFLSMSRANDLYTWHDATELARKASKCNLVYRLPTIGELGVILRNRHILGLGKSDTYWSSTEDSHFYAWALDFSTAVRQNLSKLALARVCLVRNVQ